MPLAVQARAASARPKPHTDANPIGRDAFAAAMARFAPFEDNPTLAVAVSGGRDSVALVLLAAHWAALRGGVAVGVTVDHRLRPESADEAAQVSGWLAGYGIAHHTLTWADRPGPQGPVMAGSEAAARDARYKLLEDFCRTRGILHLLIGHHRADQAETQAIRRTRASGVIGRAGMPAVRELAHVRVLRPFLAFPRKQITATLEAYDQPWIDDPSNYDMRFARARIRAVKDPPRVDPAAGAERQAVEREVARLGARAVALHPAGYARVEADILRPINDFGVVRRIFANLLTCIGGSVYPPRGARLDRLVRLVMTGDIRGGVTLGGCTVRRDPDGRVRVARELAGITAPRELSAGQPLGSVTPWDGRFRILGVPAGTQLGAAGHFRAMGLPEHLDFRGYTGVPGDVWMALPALCSDGRYRVCAPAPVLEGDEMTPQARFSPVFPLAGAIFATS